MNHVRKMVLVPYNDSVQNSKLEEIEQCGGELPIQEKTNIIKDKYKLKLVSLLKIRSKLAQINAYDEDFRIKDRNGKYMVNTDVTNLLLNAMTPGRILFGEERFIELLNEAKIPHYLIMNDAIKNKMQKIYVDSSETYIEPIINSNNVIEETQYEPVVRSNPIKRKLDDSDDEEKSTNKRPKMIGNGLKWIIPNLKKN